MALKLAPNAFLVYTDASIRNRRGGIGMYSARSGNTYGAFVRESRHIDRLELGAIFSGILLHDVDDEDIVVFTDSQNCIDGLTSVRRRPDRLLQFTKQLVEERRGDVFVSKVKAHSGNVGNTYADAAAGEATLIERETALPDDFASLDAWRVYARDNAPLVKSLRKHGIVNRMEDESTVIFKEAVNEFVDIHNQIDRASKSLRDVRRKKDELAEVILEYMEKNNYEVCSSGNAKLFKKDSKRRSSMKDEYIIAAIKEVFGTDVDPAKIIDLANSRREIIAKPSLTCKIQKI